MHEVAALQPAAQSTVLCRFLGRRRDSGAAGLWPASEKRQGTKSRDVGHGGCSGLYGDLIALPMPSVVA